MSKRGSRADGVIGSGRGYSDATRVGVGPFDGRLF